jgi:hypothetical protein
MAGHDETAVRIVSETGNGGSSRGGGDMPHLPRRLSRPQKRTLAVRLRNQGWSYRHIAQELHVPYRDVAHWLDNGATFAQPARMAVERIAARVTVGPAQARRYSPVPGVSAARDPELGRLEEENRRLVARVAALEADQAALREEVTAVEGRLRRAIRELSENVTGKLAMLIKGRDS